MKKTGRKIYLSIPANRRYIGKKPNKSIGIKSDKRISEKSNGKILDKKDESTNLNKSKEKYFDINISRLKHSTSKDSYLDKYYEKNQYSESSMEKRSYIWEKFNPKLTVNFTNDRSKVLDYDRVNKIIKAGTSIVSILENRKGEFIVKKQYVETHLIGKKRPINPEESFYNELVALKLLLGYNYFPQLLYYNKKDFELYMTYCGERMVEKTVPHNWKVQLLNIYNILKSKAIYHNDVYIGNFCVKDGRMYLIDFGFAKNHIDFCFYNFIEKDIIEAKSILDVFKQIKDNSRPIYEMLFSCY